MNPIPCAAEFVGECGVLVHGLWRSLSKAISISSIDRVSKRISRKAPKKSGANLDLCRRRCSADLGLELDTEHESGRSAAVFKDLRLEKGAHPLEPLFSGQMGMTICAADAR